MDSEPKNSAFGWIVVLTISALIASIFFIRYIITNRTAKSYPSNENEQETDNLQTMLAPIEPAITPQLIPVTDPPFRTGIFEGQSGEFHTWETQIENRWQGIVNGHYIQVYAGSLADDPKQGVIFVQVTTLDKNRSGWHKYVTPSRKGSLCIIDVEDLKLTLITPDKQTLYFDVPGQRFVSSLLEIVPTVTPLPAYPPTATVQPYP